MQTYQNIMNVFGEIVQNECCLTQMAIFGQFMGENGENEIFQKSKNEAPHVHGAATLCNNP